MFTPETWLILSEDLVKLFNGLEEEVMFELTKKLSKGGNLTASEWEKLQDVNNAKYRERVSKIIKERAKEIDAELTKTIESAINFAEKETEKAVRQLNKENKKVQLNEKEKASIIKSLKNWNKGNYEILYEQALIKNNQLQKQIIAEGKLVGKIRAKDITQTFYDSIARTITNEGIDKGFGVFYKDGSRRSYRSYIEMAIRTNIQNVASETMEKATNKIGIIFFLASEHATCAIDHADYQGKLYVNENWEEYIEDEEVRKQIESFIKRNNIKTIQWVKGAPVYFTTRPNCRHFFMPLTIEQAMGNLTELKQNVRTTAGTYRLENYQDLVKQRYNERNIRKYKQRVEANKIMLDNAKNERQKALIKRDITRNEKLFKKWNYEQYKLIKSNKSLKREKRREEIDTLAQDLGVSVSLKNK